MGADPDGDVDGEMGVELFEIASQRLAILGVDDAENQRGRTDIANAPRQVSRGHAGAEIDDAVAQRRGEESAGEQAEFVLLTRQGAKAMGGRWAAGARARVADCTTSLARADKRCSSPMPITPSSHRRPTWRMAWAKTSTETTAGSVAK